MPIFAFVLAVCGVIFSYGLPIDAQAHSGGLDSKGCHAGSRPYHCHRTQSEMVGNRLRCDLGSRSKECQKKRPAPKIPDSDKAKENPIATINDGSIVAKQSKLPTEFNSGIGLHCLKDKNKEKLFIFTQSKQVVGEVYYRDDIVNYERFSVSVTADYLSWYSGKLDRQSLSLNAGYSCTILSPSEVHQKAFESLQKKLNKNKL